MLVTTGKVGNRNKEGSDTVLSRAVSNHWTGLLGLISLTVSAQVQHRSFTLTANSHIMDIVVSIEYYNHWWILMRTDWAVNCYTSWCIPTHPLYWATRIYTSHHFTTQEHVFYPDYTLSCMYFFPINIRWGCIWLINLWSFELCIVDKVGFLLCLHL